MNQSAGSGLTIGLPVVVTARTFPALALVVHELQRRGVYRTAYRPGTLREKLFGRGPRLPGSHRGARYRTGDVGAVGSG